MIHLKFKEDEEDTELISFIKDGVGDFDLPKFINLPRGERAMTSRARMLMIAGLEALKKEFPKKLGLVLLIRSYSSAIYNCKIIKAFNIIHLG